MPKQTTQHGPLHCEIAGSGPPLLLLHGLGSNGRDWQAQVMAFKNRFTVITPDLLGHGRSTKPPGPYSIHLFASQIKALLKNLACGPTHLAGLSLGGMIGLQLAIDSPYLLKSLTLINTETDYRPHTVRQRWQLWQRLLIIRLLGMHGMGVILSRRLFPKFEQAELRKRFIRQWSANDPKSYTACLQAITDWHVTEQLTRIHCPTLIIGAAHDYTPISGKKITADRIPKARLLVIPDSRHATPVDQPERFNQALLFFLTDIEGFPHKDGPG